MEKSPEDPWTRVVGASLPLGRISDWFQVKGQIKSTSEDRDKEKKGPRCVPGGIPVEVPKTRRTFSHSLNQEQGSYGGPSSTGWKNQGPSGVQKNPHEITPCNCNRNNRSYNCSLMTHEKML